MSKKVNNFTDPILASYLSDISKYKILDSSEIAELINKAQAGDDIARETLITSNLRFVVSIAKQYQNRGIELSDLISEGVYGLAKSIDKFDIAKGTTFLTYAGWWVKQCIYNIIYNNGNTIRLPISQRLLVLKIVDTTNEFIHKHSKQPSVEELSELTGISTQQINYLSQFSNKLISLNEFIGSDEDGSQFGDTLANGDLLLDDQINKQMILQNLNTMLNTLSAKEYDLICMTFGINMDPVDPVKIANMFGVCKERIRQMKKAALNKLKTRFSKQLIELL